MIKVLKEKSEFKDRKMVSGNKMVSFKFLLSVCRDFETIERGFCLKFSVLTVGSVFCNEILWFFMSMMNFFVVYPVECDGFWIKSFFFFLFESQKEGREKMRERIS